MQEAGLNQGNKCIWVTCSHRVWWLGIAHPFFLSLEPRGLWSVFVFFFFFFLVGRHQNWLLFQAPGCNLVVECWPGLYKSLDLILSEIKQTTEQALCWQEYGTIAMTIHIHAGRNAAWQSHWGKHFGDSFKAEHTSWWLRPAFPFLGLQEGSVMIDWPPSQATAILEYWAVSLAKGLLFACTPS